MSWELFRSIVDQIPNLQRAVLHGVGEPMLVKDLPRMVRYLKDRGTYVLFNTNGTVLNEKNGRALIEAELDELRVSFDAANAESYRAIRGKNYFHRIFKNVRLVPRTAGAQGRAQAAGVGVAHRHARDRRAIAGFRAGHSKDRREGSLSSAARLLLRRMPSARRSQTRRSTSGCRARRRSISIALPRSRIARRHFQRLGRDSEPGMSLKRSANGSPWSLCRRPWTVMYFTANGRALPCCIAPFSQRGYGITRSAMPPSRRSAKSGPDRPTAISVMR